MKNFLLAAAAIAATASADVKSQYDSEFVDSVLELKIKDKIDFFDELNVHLIDIEALHGKDASIYKISKAKMLYLRKQFPAARKLLESVDLNDDLYFESLKAYVKYSTLLKDADGQLKSLKQLFSSKSYYKKSVDGDSDNENYAREYLSLVSSGQFKNSVQTTLLKKIMKEQGWGTGLNLKDLHRYVEMLDLFEDKVLNESWSEGKQVATQAEIKEFAEIVEKMAWVNPKATEYLLFLPLAARAQAMQGQADKGFGALNQSFPDVVEYETALKEQLEKEGRKDWYLFSPVPATNYALAMTYYFKAEQLFKKGQRAQALGYLLGKKGGSTKITNGALQLLFLLIKHPAYKQNEVALRAPFKINKVVALINKINTGKKQITLPPFEGDLYGEANYKIGNWKEATKAYESYFEVAKDDNSKKRNAASLGLNYLRSIANQKRYAYLEEAVKKLRPFKGVRKPKHFFVQDVNFAANEIVKFINSLENPQHKKNNTERRKRILKELAGLSLGTEQENILLYNEAQALFAILSDRFTKKLPLQPERLQKLEAKYKKIIKTGGTSQVATLSIFKLAYAYELHKKYDLSLQYWNEYYNKVGNLTEVNKADKLDALSRIAKVEYSKEASSQAYLAAAKRFKDEYKKTASSLSDEKAKVKAEKAKNRIDFIVIEAANAKLYTFKGQLRELKKELASSSNRKVVQVKVDRLNTQIRKESAKSLNEYNSWLNENSGNRNYAYVLAKKADLLYLLGDKSSLVEAEKIEALLQKNFPGSSVVESRRTKFIEIKVQEGSWTEAIEAAKKLVATGKVEKQSDFVLDKVLKMFLFETKPNKKEVSKEEFKGASMIANRCADVLQKRFAQKEGEEARAILYMFLKGKSFVYLRKSEEAKKCFASITSKSPKTSYLFDIKYLEAIIEAQSGKFAEAHKLLQEVIALAQRTKPKRYGVLFKAYTTEVAIYSASKNKAEIQTAFRMAELAKDIVIDNPKPSQQALIAKLQERVHYYWIKNAAKLGIPYKEEQKRFIATYFSSPYLDDVRKASQFESTFK